MGGKPDRSQRFYGVIVKPSPLRRQGPKFSE